MTRTRGDSLCSSNERHLLSVVDISNPTDADTPPGHGAAWGGPRDPVGHGRLWKSRLAILNRCRRYYYQGQRLLAQLAQNPDLINDGLPAHHIEQLQELQATGAAAHQTFPIFDDVSVLQVEAPPALIDGRLPCQALAVIYGQPEMGKSFVMVSLACSVATGRPWLGARVLRRGPVVYDMGEGASHFGLRLAAWKRFQGFDLASVIGVHPIPEVVQLRDPAHVEAFIRDIEPLHPVLVIIDTLARASEGVNENDAGEMGLVIGGADRIRRRLGCAVTLIHHTTKSGETERGSGALRGAADVMWHLIDNNDLRTLACTKSKDAPAFEPFGLRLVPQDDGGCIVKLAIDSPESTEPTTKDLAALRALAESFGESGARFGEWERVAGVPPRSFARVVKHLQATGLISQVSSVYRLTDQARGRLL